MGKEFKLRNGKLFVVAETSGGMYNPQQLKKLATICEQENTVLRATEDQRLGLMILPEKLASLSQDIKSLGLGVRHYRDGLHQATSCLGELCEEKEQDALQSSLDITQALAKISLEQQVRIGVNGCARCCLPCHTLDISIVGETAGYKIYLGGKNSQIPELASYVAEGVPAAELPGLILNIINIYKDNCEAEETLNDTLNRIGLSKFIEVLKPYSQDAGESSVDDMNTQNTGGEEMSSPENNSQNVEEISEEIETESLSDDLSPNLEQNLSGEQNDSVDISPIEMSEEENINLTFDESEDLLPQEVPSEDMETPTEEAVMPAEDVALVGEETVVAEDNILPEGDIMAMAEEVPMEFEGVSEETMVESSIPDNAEEELAAEISHSITDEKEELGEIKTEHETNEQRESTLKLISNNQATAQETTPRSEAKTARDFIRKVKFDGQFIQVGFSSGMELGIEPEMILVDGDQNTIEVGDMEITVKRTENFYEIIFSGGMMKLPRKVSA